VEWIEPEKARSPGRSAGAAGKREDAALALHKKQEAAAGGHPTHFA
jgi:hypothetical protein